KGPFSGCPMFSCGTEWVDGKVIVLSPASERHQALRGFLEAVMTVYAEQRGLGRVLGAPFQMKTGPGLPFIATGNLSQLKKNYLDGPADLVVEITSPESRLLDRGEKFAEYELGGVREYWLLDPEGQRADFYKLGEDGRYRLSDPEASGVYRSKALPGFWLRVAWFWQEPLPAVLEVLRELELI
ncbi:MAG: Uma2 family endonuclease, partial [Anaerolineae bacterium]